MKNYQEMSDRSIDLEVFQIIFGKDVFTKDADLRRAWERGISYCNSWADAGPIIQENGINLMASKVVDSAGLKEWEAMSYEGNCHHWGELNPLRAAMIVFLMMKGGE